MNNTINNHTTPVELAIDMFGGVRKLARALGRDPAAVSRWQKSGVVPTAPPH
jgi:DNA-binding transcriptional regulator YdaS (Cro superfamily)